MDFREVFLLKFDLLYSRIEHFFEIDKSFLVQQGDDENYSDLNLLNKIELLENNMFSTTP